MRRILDRECGHPRGGEEVVPWALLMYAVLLLGPIRRWPGGGSWCSKGSPGNTRAWHSVLVADVVNVIP